MWKDQSWPNHPSNGAQWTQAKFDARYALFIPRTWIKDPVPALDPAAEIIHDHRNFINSYRITINSYRSVWELDDVDFNDLVAISQTDAAFHGVHIFDKVEEMWVDPLSPDDISYLCGYYARLKVESHEIDPPYRLPSVDILKLENGDAYYAGWMDGREEGSLTRLDKLEAAESSRKSLPDLLDPLHL